MKNYFEIIDSCRLCASKSLEKILDLNEQPPANSLYRPGDDEPCPAPLELMFCRSCSAVQLSATVNPEYLFTKYVWVTGTSKTAIDYSAEFAKNALIRCSSDASSVLEIASNDGTFLKKFSESGLNVLGVDPAQNIAATATQQGIPTIPEFFNLELAKNLEQDGKRDIIFARNVLPHVKEILSMIQGIQLLLRDGGLGVIEFHDAGLILEELHYDSVYHEHLFLLSLETLSKLLKQYNLHVFDILKSPISGGSWVVYFSNKKRDKTEALLAAEKRDKDHGINTLERWKEFGLRATVHSNQLKQAIDQYNGKIVAYGASARSSTLLNFCRLSNKNISAIIDKNPLKHGLLTPGTNIPIISYEDFLQDIENTKTILLLAWNFKEEVIKDLTRDGFKGEFIVPLPYGVHKE